MRSSLLYGSGLVVCVIIFFWYTDRNKRETSFQFTANEIAASFRDNESLANAELSGQKIVVQGKVARINDRGDIIFLETDQGIYVSCALDEKDIANPKVGSEVIIEGVCIGILMDIQLNQCRLL